MKKNYLALGCLVLIAHAVFAQVSLNYKLDYKIGQLLMVGFRGISTKTPNPILEQIASHHIGATILFDYDVTSKQFDRNIQSPTQLKTLCQNLQRLSPTSPLIIAIDQEGGRVNRLKEKYGFPKSVSAQYLGNLQNLDSTQFYARQTAKTLSELGINLNFAPVCDVNTNPENPVIGKLERSFANHPDSVTRHAEAIIEAHHQFRVACALKHFPGHGSSKADSHLGFTDVSNTWKALELIPFAALASKTDLIMTAHIFNSTWDTVPATLSKKIITTLLRDSLKFIGVVVSDDLQMKAIASTYTLEHSIELALNAGVDMLTFGNNIDYDEQIIQKVFTIIKKLIKERKVSEERINESFARIQTLKAKLTR
jgi:beta-N-acetylhexosaminidase